MNTNHYGRYFKNSVLFLTKNEFFLFICILFEYFIIFSESMNAAMKLGYFNEIFTAEYDGQSYLSYLSAYFYFRKLKVCSKDDSMPYSFNCSYSPYMVLIPVIFLINYFCYVECFQYSKSESDKKEGMLSKLYNRFMINFYDMIYFRCAGVFMLDISVNFLIASRYFVDPTKKFLLIIAGLINLVFLIIFYFQHITNFNLWIKMVPTISYPFDRNISAKYEKSLLIMKILLAFETNIFDNSNKVITYQDIFLNILIVFFIMKFNIEMLYTLCFTSASFFMNKRKNMLRMFISIFNALSVAFMILFQRILSTVFAVVLFCSLALLSLFAVLAIETASRKKILFGNNMIAQILFLLNEITCGGIESTNQMISDLIIDHKTKCLKTSTCVLCEAVKRYSSLTLDKNKGIRYGNVQCMMTHDISLQKNNTTTCENLSNELLNPIFFVGLLYKMFKQTMKNKYESIDKELEQDFDFVRIAICYLRKNQNIFKLHTLFFNLIIKYQNERKIGLSYNLEMYYEQFCKSHESETKKFQYLFVIEKTTTQIRHFLGFLENFLFYTNKDPLSFVEASEEIKKLKDSAKYSFFVKKETPPNYQLLVINYLLEEILNRRLAKHLESIKDEIKSQEDFLEVHFKHDKCLLLKYEIQDNKFIISQAGSDFQDMNQCIFEHLIPAEFREAGKQIFLDLLNRNNFIDKKNCYEFVFKDDGNYVRLFKMKYNVYPSLIDKEMLINGEYMIGSEEILIFHLLDLQDGKSCQVLHSFSKRIGRFFLLEPEWVDVLSRKKKLILFDDMLLPCFIEQNAKKSNSKAYILNAEKFVHTIGGYLNSERIEMGIDVNDLHLKLADFARSCLSNRRVLILTKKLKITNSRMNNFIVYSVKEKSENKICVRSPSYYLDGKCDKDYYNNDSSMADENKNQNENDNTYNPAFFLTSNTSSICGTSITTKSNLSHVKNSSERKLRQEKRKEYKRFKKFTLFIVCFNIFLLLFTLTFLVIETNENEGFKNLSQVYINFRKLNRYFFHNTLSLFSNFCICQTGTSVCSNKYVQYSIAFRKENAVMADYMINKYIERELDLKATGMQAAFKTCEKELYHLNNEDLNGILSNDFKYFSIERGEGFLTSSQKTITFSEAIGLYVNTIGLIINTEGYLEFPLYILSIEGDHVNLSNIYLPETINDIQMYCYNLIINYENYITRLFEIDNVLKVKFNQIINKNEVIVLAFTIGLIGLYCVLLILCLCFINMFKIIIKKYIKDMMDKITLTKQVDYWKKKISNMKMLLKFYEENPNQIISTLNSLKPPEGDEKEKDKDKEKEKEKDNAQDRTTDLRMKFYFRDEYHNLIVIKFIYITLVTVGIYFVYCLSYYSFLLVSLNNLRIAVDYFDTNASMEDNVFITLGLIHLMALTNQTEQMFSDKFAYTGSNGFVSNKIQTTLEAITDIEKMEITYPGLLGGMNNTLDLDCNILFKTLNDSVMFQTNQLYPTRNYYDMAAHICRSVAAVSFLKDDKILTQDIIYNSQKLLSLFTLRRYSNLMKILSNDLLYELYTVILILFRQLRTYVNDTLFPNLIDSVTGSYTIAIVTFLLLNFMVEAIMLAILHFCMIKRIVNINKDMISLYNCLME